MPKTASITVKFEPAEAAELKARATAAGLPLRTFVRRCAVSCGELSREAALILAEVRRVRELICRFRAVDEGGVLASHAEVEAWVYGRALLRGVKGNGK